MVPEFFNFMLPLLKSLADGKTYSSDECAQKVSELLNLSEADKNELTRNGSRTKVIDRTQWSKTYLQWAGLVKTVRRGYYAITDKGLDLLQKDLSIITRNYLAENYPEFKENSKREKPQKIKKKTEIKVADKHEVKDFNPANEQNEPASLSSAFANASPDVIKTLISKALTALGYYSDSEFFSAEKENVSGCAFIDKLHISPFFVYVSLANSVVSRNDIGKILPLMYEKSCNNGLYITMGTFSSEAKRFMAASTNIKKMDIKEFSQILYENKIGVRNIYTTVIDEEFFK
ncbi:MAG TPA: winged helix-turn-helix domain-containing protein [Desulfobacteraceae bacterium]|mgnify:CR=1 FL=1|nr:winged helix-turn-helix domain-containing protein [Desulfobacteraceae bacterium]